MAAAGIGLLSDTDEWKSFSARAREGAERFSADRVVSLYEAFYEEVLRQ
jgi:hypothetical protein